MTVPHHLRGALVGWVHWRRTEGQVGDEDAADGRQPWGLDQWAKTQCWLLRLEFELSICRILHPIILWFCIYCSLYVYKRWQHQSHPGILMIYFACKGATCLFILVLVSHKLLSNIVLTLFIAIWGMFLFHSLNT